MKNAFRSRCEPAAQPTVTLVRYVRRRVHCANEVEDAGTPACATKLEVPQRMQARRDRNGASAYTSGHRAQVAVCHRLCQPRTPAAPSASALMARGDVSTFPILSRPDPGYGGVCRSGSLLGGDARILPHITRLLSMPANDMLPLHCGIALARARDTSVTPEH